MLRQDVVEAVEAKQFQVYPVDHVDQALSLLTGQSAGEMDEKGEFPEGSVNRKIRDRLLDFAEKRRAFGKPESKEDETADAGKSS